MFRPSNRWRRPTPPHPGGAAPRPPERPARTFVGRLWVRRERDVVELPQAEPLSVHGDAKVAEIDGLPGGLRDLVCGGGRGLALGRQIRHDDSAFGGQTHEGRTTKIGGAPLFWGGG